MKTDFDIIIIGSGPAGVSAAFPLVESGLKVLMVDGGFAPSTSLPKNPYLTSREFDITQWKWMIGSKFHALENINTSSPKLRVPGLDYVFHGHNELNQIHTKDFLLVGSMATGGLSNAWGCGVSCLSKSEAKEYPFDYAELKQSYGTIAKRIGISGRHSDDLRDYFGVDSWAQPPIKLDLLHQHIYKKYQLNQKKLASMGFQLGRSRVAALSEPKSGRLACDLSGNCLWGCDRGSLYSTLHDISTLSKYENFFHLSGFVVKQFTKKNLEWSIEGHKKSARDSNSITAKKLILAAGTLATTRLALNALEIKSSVRLLSNPTAAFLLWTPSLTGLKQSNTFGLGQLSFNLKLPDNISAFGSSFTTTGIPVSEFARHLPIGRRYSIDLLKQLLSSCIVGNVFLPGQHSSNEVRANKYGSLVVNGGFQQSTPEIMRRIERALRKAYWLSGAILVPGSFTTGKPGSDIHYAGTLPMRNFPKLGETDPNGELFGKKGVYVVDGSSLPNLLEKSHTLTIMANADRIGRMIAKP